MWRQQGAGGLGGRGKFLAVVLTSDMAQAGPDSLLQQFLVADPAPYSERHQGHVQSSNAGSRRTRSSCWWLSKLFAAANSAQHAALPLGAWMKTLEIRQKVCLRWSDDRGRGMKGELCWATELMQIASSRIVILRVKQANSVTRKG